jgi:thiol-disulfide isomerase/thioredoxin
MHKKLTVSFLLLFTVICSLFTSHDSFAQNKTNLTIKGKINNNIYKTIFIDKFSNEPAKIDSAAIVNNAFELNVSIPETGFFTLRLADDKTMIFIFSPGEKVDVTFDAANFQLPMILSGSPQSAQVFDLTQKIAQCQLWQDSLNQVYEHNKTNPKLDSIVLGLRVSFDKFADRQIKLIVDFLNNNLTSLGGMLFINRLNMNDYAASFIRYDSALIKTYPNNGLVRDFHAQVTRNLSLSVGQVAPDIKEKDTTGKEVPLSSLRGKVVLIDFWASWCGPCRHENPHMVKLYNEYHNKGFEIYGFSLDKNKDAWLNAIRRDKLFWTQVSDLQYWNSGVAQLYNVSSIPYTVLLDRKGKIIAKGIMGQEIDNRLDMLFKSENKQ